MRLLACLLFIVSLFFLSSIALAHPGNTDYSGGHTCRTDCSYWGYSYSEYHYHDGSYYEPDYYDQGFEFGGGEGFENNRDNIKSQATLYATQEAKEDGENGYDEELYPSAPDSVCDLEFDYRAGEYQDYIDGVNEGFYDSCIAYANEVYKDEYALAYESAYETYESSKAEDSESSEIENFSSTSDSSNDWLVSVGILVAFFGFFGIVGNWDSLKDWWKNG